MVSRNIKRVSAVVPVVLGALIVCKCQISETAWSRAEQNISAKRGNYAEEISADELKQFIKHWPEFNELGLQNDVDFATTIQGKEINWKLRLWFTYHHWDGERFFYVKQRLLKLLNEIKVRREAENIIAHLSGKKETVVLQMIELQKKRIKTQDITPNELILLTAREKELRKMFKQYP